MDAAPRIHLIHSNRMERLADWLAELVRRDRPDFPFERTPIVVPQAGLGQWLEQALARRLGVACGLEFPLPARYLWELVGRGLGELPERSPFARGALAWRLFERLAEHDEGPWRATVRAGGDAARFALAEQLAAMFDRYLVYRPDLVARWERGATTGLAHEDWQAALWRELAREVRAPHRAKLLAKYLRALRAGKLEPGSLPARIYLFGLNPMPPELWRAYEAISARVEIVAFVPDPSRTLWWESTETGAATNPVIPAKAGIHSSDGTKSNMDSRLRGNGGASAASSETHPLLQQCGVLGRDFLRMVYASNIERDDREGHVESESRTLLGRVQDSLLRNDARAIAGAHDPRDRSLTLHACAGPWREVEALHDALLARFAADPSLKPSDVVVMAPDLARYAPYVDAVFGHVAPERRVPFRLADLGAVERSSVLAALLRALTLPEDRFVLGDVLAFAELPEVRARFGLEPGAPAACAEWLREAGVRWGWDGAHRAQWGAGADAGGSFAFGLRRLLLGYASGDDGALVAGAAPCVPVEGGDADALGRLLDLLQTLAGLRGTLALPRAAPRWVELTARVFGELFAAAADPRVYLEAESLLRVALERIAGDVALAGADGELTREAWLVALRGALDEIGRGAAFLSGAVTVCGMVPLRAVPFRVVCVLGLDERAFPRGESVPAYDLMRVAPRAGDRNVIADDRYAFLEAIVAARDALHLSWSASEPGGAAQAPSPVIGELLDLVARDGCDGDAAAARAALVVAHAETSYAPDAFRADARWPSHSGEALAAARAALETPAPRPRFATASGPAEELRVLPLARLVELLTRPQSAWLARLGVRVLRADEEGELHLSDVSGLGRFQIRERALELLACDAATDARALRERLAAEALLPPGAAGAREVEGALAEAQDVLARAAARGWRAGPRERRALRLELGGTTLIGRVDASPWVRFRAGRLRAADLFAWWIEALAASASGGARETLHALGIADRKGERDAALPLVDEPREALAALVALARRAAAEPLPLFPETCAAYARLIAAREPEDVALLAAKHAWLGDGERGECASAKIAAFARGWDPVEDPRFPDVALAAHGGWTRAEASP